MKTLFLIGVLLSSTMTMFAQLFDGQDDGPEPGVTVEVREVKPFNTLRVSRGINVTLVERDNNEAEIHIKNTDPEDVIIEQEDNHIHVRMKSRFNRDIAVNVYLSYQQIKEISVGSGASVYSEDLILANHLTLVAGADASINLSLEVNTLEASTSASRIKVDGTAKNIDINATTGGTFAGFVLESKNAKVRANTGANVEIWVTDKLEASAGSGASVKYRGNPGQTDGRTSLGGNIEKM
ncbi:DUF2807 domain-containing protein [Marinilabiliaceae bacterium ANBcel2]|nr:DUF2807 domain-containing protein [Marinilabiliaceae bacterium ANBcel2]